MVTQGKVYDLELVGVPARQAARWRASVPFAAGLLVGGLAIGLYASFDAKSPAPVQPESRSSQIQQGILRNQLARASQRIVSLSDQLERARSEANQLRTEIAKLTTALALADDAIEAAERERQLWRSRGGLRSSSIDPSSERSVPPTSQRRTVTGGYEETPAFNRIFVPTTPNVTLQDIARAYGVSINALKAVNPSLVIKRTRDGDFVREGAEVRIPVHRR